MVKIQYVVGIWHRWVYTKSNTNVRSTVGMWFTKVWGPPWVRVHHGYVVHQGMGSAMG